MNMQKLIAELLRLYLPLGNVLIDVLERHISGSHTISTSLVSADGMTRAIVIPFNKLSDNDCDQHWTLLCDVANALQTELALPAPAVSISGDTGFALWLSLDEAVSVGVAQRFLGLLRRAYFPTVEFGIPAVSAPVELPPCVHQRTGRWAAFINPGLGAAFADESGLEMPPPLAGQVALLENLERISEKKFLHAMSLLQQSHGEAEVTPAPSVRAPAGQGLLLKEATLEDIIRHLHSLDIEPTFRHLIRKP